MAHPPLHVGAALVPLATASFPLHVPVLRRSLLLDVAVTGPIFLLFVGGLPPRRHPFDRGVSGPLVPLRPLPSFVRRVPLPRENAKRKFALRDVAGVAWVHAVHVIIPLPGVVAFIQIAPGPARPLAHLHSPV